MGFASQDPCIALRVERRAETRVLFFIQHLSYTLVSRVNIRRWKSQYPQWKESGKQYYKL